MRPPPPLSDPDLWQSFLGVLRTGKSFGTACRVARMSRRAVENWLALNPDKATEVMEATLEATELVEEKLYELAVGGEMRAVVLWLERRSRDRWAPEKAGGGGGAVRIVLDPAELSRMALGSGPPGDSVVEDDGLGIVETLPDIAVSGIGDSEA